MSEEVSRGDYKFARGSEEGEDEERRMTLLLPLERLRLRRRREREREREGEGELPWHILLLLLHRRFYGNVAKRDIADLFPQLGGQSLK